MKKRNTTGSVPKHRKPGKKRRSGLWYRYRFYLLSALMPLVVLTIAYMILKVWPFGERQVQLIDSYHQYAPFFAEYRRKLLSGDSLFYSWKGGMGMNFWMICAYYLGSPLNLLLVLFPEGGVLEGFTFLLMMKIALSGLTFAVYIRHHFHRYDWSVVGFASAYALCGWTLGYNWNVMWLDTLALLPLVILGAERLIRTGKGLFYALMLGLVMSINYYLGIMVCIYLILYFFVFYAEQNALRDRRSGRRIKKTLKVFLIRGFAYLGYSILGVCMSAVLLLPTLTGLMVSNNAESSFPKVIRFYNSVSEMIAQHFALIEPTDLSGRPNMYFGVLGVMLVFLYIFRKGIPVRKRVIRILLMAFLILSTNFRILDYIWHGFHFPNSLPARFTFIYAFLGLTMAYEALMAIQHYRWWQIVLCTMIVPTALLIFCVRKGSQDMDTWVYLVNGGLVDAYFLLICLIRGLGAPVPLPIPKKPESEIPDAEVPSDGEAAVLSADAGEKPEPAPVLQPDPETVRLYKKKRRRTLRSRQAIAFALGLLFLAEAGVNGVYGLKKNGSINRTSYNQLIPVADQLTKTAREDAAGDFYRMELDTFSARNNNMYLNLPGISLFASTMGADLNALMGKVGYFSATNKYSYVGALSLTDSIFSIKYLMAAERGDQIRTFRLMQSADKKSLYKNEQALSVGFMVDPDYADWNVELETPWEVLNDYVVRTTGIMDPLFTERVMPEALTEDCSLSEEEPHLLKYTKETKGDEGTISWHVSFPEGESWYIWYQAPNCDKLKVTEGDHTESYTDTRGHFASLGTGGEADLTLITDDSHKTGTIKLWLLRYDDAVFERFYEIVSASQMTVTHFDTTSLTGTVTAESDGLLYTSIPYDAGWTVRVDARPVEAKSVSGTLMYIPLSAGTHHLTFSYTPRGWLPGALISAASMLIWLLLLILDRRENSRLMRSKKTLRKKGGLQNL